MAVFFNWLEIKLYQFFFLNNWLCWASTSQLQHTLPLSQLELWDYSIHLWHWPRGDSSGGAAGLLLHFLLERLGGSREGIFHQTTIEVHLNSAMPWSSLFLICMEAQKLRDWLKGTEREKQKQERLQCKRNRGKTLDRTGRSSGWKPLPLWLSVLILQLEKAEWIGEQMPFISLTSITSSRLGQSSRICPRFHLPFLGAQTHPQRKRVSWAESGQKNRVGIKGYQGDIENTGLPDHPNKMSIRTKERMFRHTGPSALARNGRGQEASIKCFLLCPSCYHLQDVVPGFLHTLFQVGFFSVPIL